jgi:GTP-binding protein HflX
LTIDEDDLMKNAKTLHARRVESDLDEPRAKKMHCLFRLRTKKISKSLENARSRKANSHHPFPYNKFLYPDYKDAVEKEEKDEEENE